MQLLLLLLLFIIIIIIIIIIYFLKCSNTNIVMYNMQGHNEK